MCTNLLSNKTIEVYVNTLAKVHSTQYRYRYPSCILCPTWVKTIEVQHADHTEKRVNINVTFGSRDGNIYIGQGVTRCMAESVTLSNYKRLNDED